MKRLAVAGRAASGARRHAVLQLGQRAGERLRVPGQLRAELVRAMYSLRPRDGELHEGRRDRRDDREDQPAERARAVLVIRRSAEYPGEAHGMGHPL